MYLQFPSLFEPYDISKCETRCQLVQEIYHFNVADFIAIVNFEWNSQSWRYWHCIADLSKTVL